MRSINILKKFGQIDKYYNPKIIAELNGHQVKIAKLKGDFIRHNHEDEDELFYVLKGKLKMVFDDKTVIIKEGEMLVVPKKVYHKPCADEEVWLMLFEPASTLNTGNVLSELTVLTPEKI
ncbi:MAG: hypothetical protein HGGPFJEG_02504 [Ignavibacteria bacterium]|nr:hypothetical protein [Ignavibacteria bacterium]